MKRILPLVVVFAFSGMCQAQDAHFSQFYETATLRNPALVGVFSGDYKVGATHRNQWSGLGVPFVTTNVAAESRIMILKETNDFLSFGVNALFDKAGSIDFATNNFYGAVNYNKSLGASNTTFLSVGLAGGYNQRSVNLAKMRFSSQYQNGVFDQNNNAASQVSNDVLRQFDAGAGISLNGSIGSRITYYGGIAGYHLSKPSATYLGQDFVRLATRWNGSLGISAGLSPRTALVFHGNYQMQGPYRQLAAGGFAQSVFGSPTEQLKRVVLSAGCFYRNADALIPTQRYDWNTVVF